MKTEKKIVLTFLLSIFMFFIIYVVQEHVKWAKSVSGKEFRGEIVQLSSKMTTGKYPRPEEYAMVKWEEDGTTSYFQIAPVHNYSVGDTWVTKLDFGVFESPGGCCGNLKIPESKKETSWLNLTYDFLVTLMYVCIAVGIIVGIISIFWWCFSNEE